MNKNLQSFLSILLSGAAWYLAFDLSGQFGWLLWLAPIPVLYTCYRVTAGRAFLFAFTSLLIGRLSWLPYLISVLPMAIAILFTVFFPLVFALIVWVQRRVVLRWAPWISALILPLLWTTFEFIMSRLGRDGTIGSIAYTQSNYLPLIQLASLTGMTGISFLLNFIPSSIAVSWFHLRQGKWRDDPQGDRDPGANPHAGPTGSTRPAGPTRQGNLRAARFLALPLGLLILVLVFGWIRLASHPAPTAEPSGQSTAASGSQAAGQILLNPAASPIHLLLLSGAEAIYQYNVLDPRSEKEMLIAGGYLRQIDSQIRPGTDLVLLPEKAMPMNETAERSITDSFVSAARRHQVAIIGGFSRIGQRHFDNIALVISREGRLLADYRKVNLFEGEVMEGFSKGDTTGIFHADWPLTPAPAQPAPMPTQPSTQLAPLPSGVAICKDLDFDDFIRRYDRDKIAVLYVPAWDFEKDGWYHARVAILRGVENGFAIVRSARQGRLTISDPLGRVLYEASSENGQPASLYGSLQPVPLTTLYSRWGDWFAWINLAGAFCCLLLIKRRRPIV
jgi:apolipoprotein N-acyltransferase